MKDNNSFDSKVKGGLIVSCQALPGEPLHSPFIMGRMALAAYDGGAVGIRANSVEDIKEIRKNVDLPIIGIIKREYDDAESFITPTMTEIDELMTVSPDVIAIDATSSTRPNDEKLPEFIDKIKEKYPNLLLMADCSTLEEAVKASELGIDYIGTTLVGYTTQSNGFKIEDNDFELIRQMIEKIDKPIIAEGNINTPEKAKRVLELGAHTVVVGSSITRPQIITKNFVDKIKE